MLKLKYTLTLFFISFITIAQDTNNTKLFSSKLDKFLNVRDFTISNDGDEVFFTIQSPSSGISQIASMHKVDGDWGEPFIVSFCDSFAYLEPFLTDDGKRLYFASNKPMDDSVNTKKDFDIWYVTRDSKNETWSKPINLGKPVNTEYDEFYPTLSKNNNLYFTLDAPKGLGKDDIYFSKWNGTSYSEPVILNENVNSAGYEFNAFISKDEHFLIYSKYNAKDGLGSGDLYVSRKDKDGVWQQAENLTESINTKYMEYCPFYHEQTQTLYFTSRRDELEPKEFKNINEFQDYVLKGANGLSKIYYSKIKID